LTTAARARLLPRPPRIRRAHWIALSLFVVLSSVAGWALRGGKPERSRASFETNFADLSLKDQENRHFAVSALAGKVVLYNFIFTACPNICPKQTRALVEVQRALSPEARPHAHFVSVTIDPSNDTPAALKAFAARLDVDFANWTFVTGPVGDMDRLAERLRLFASDNPSERPAAHSTTLWLVDTQGRLVQKYAGNPPDVKRVAGEMSRLSALSGD
jgi:cytochrome oxidase Cu insertion factor (SCO1/SenC/PrrC family)